MQTTGQFKRLSWPALFVDAGAGASRVWRQPIRPAATVDAGSLYVSVADGTLDRLDRSEQSWKKAGRGTPRVGVPGRGGCSIDSGNGRREKGKDLDLMDSAVNQVR